VIRVQRDPERAMVIADLPVLNLSVNRRKTACRNALKFDEIRAAAADQLKAPPPGRNRVDFCQQIGYDEIPVVPHIGW